ncbi:hypothetical protein [Rhizohabitans arisaemae]|uniref:hypothetical protein n=1 Tax=Rhizohabitans arisaemae TaxID=2720610 RepID=UPI0024B13B99|nr:hypothetical protein [Rhizohabitans arisaemae]
MLKRIATGLVAAAVGGTVLGVAAPATASPDPGPVIGNISVNPDPVVIRGWDSVQVVVTVNTRGADRVSADISPAGGGTPLSTKSDDPVPDLPRGVVEKPTGHGDWKRSVFSWTLDRNDPAGRWNVNVTARGADGKVANDGRSFYVKHVSKRYPHPTGPRETKLSFDASPEPVKKGSWLKLAGRLTVSDCYGRYGWDDSAWEWDGCRDDDYVDGNVHVYNFGGWHGWRGYGNQDVALFFKPDGSHRWQHVDTVTTSWKGYFQTKVPAWKSGTWKAVYKGHRWVDDAVAYDHVKVYRH